MLNDAEEVVVDLRPHWQFLAGPAAALAAAPVALVALALQGAPEVFQVMAAVVIVAVLGWFVVRYCRWVTTNFVVTTDRLIHRAGVLTRRRIEIPLEHVNTVFCHQSLVERILRSGDLVIESAGESGRQSFSDISHPTQVQNEIYRQIEDNAARMRHGHPAREGGEESVLDQLDKLDQLRRRGVISDAEFGAKKTQLLDRL